MRWNFALYVNPEVNVNESGIFIDTTKKLLRIVWGWKFFFFELSKQKNC